MNILFKNIINWNYLYTNYDWIKTMESCPQDPRWHGEGNVLNHTKMVLTEMLKLDKFQELNDHEKLILTVSAIMHDIGKVETTRIEEDGIHAPRHAIRGSVMARKILWKLGVEFSTREIICNLIKFHMKPSHMFDNNNYDRKIVEIASSVKCRYLGILCNSDALGRIANDLKEAEQKVLMFEERSKELKCFDNPYKFHNDHTRVQYFNKQNKNLTDAIYDDTSFTVTMMSGLPASGKDYWIQKNIPDQPMISLDEIRNRIGVGPEENQAPVIRDAKEQAKKLLGKKISFVYNATNLSRDLRSQSLALMRPYNPYIKIVYVEVPQSIQADRNAKRKETKVPDYAIDDMLNRWEIPDLTEAHEIIHIIKN